MLTAYGQGRRATIYRWVALARSLDKATIDKLYERRDLGFSLALKLQWETFCQPTDFLVNVRVDRK